MLEIRIKANSVKEVNDCVSFLRSNPFVGYIFYDISKVYIMKNGQYKFFASCLDYNSYKECQIISCSAHSAPMVKKRGRKPKILKTL